MSIRTPAIYVACIADYGASHSYVLALNPEDLSVVETARLETPLAARLMITPDGQKLWVSHPSASKISVLNAKTLELIESIDCTLSGGLSNYEMTVRITGSGIFKIPKVLIPCENSNNILVYDMHLREPDHQIPVDTGTSGPAMILLASTEEAVVYPITPGTNQIAFVNLGAEESLETAEQTGEISYEERNQLAEYAYDRESNTLFINNWTPHGHIKVVDISSRTVRETINFPDLHPRALALSNDGNYLFIGFTPGAFASPSLKMLRLSDYEVVFSLDVPNNPRSLVLNHTGDKIFLSEHGSHEIYAYDIDLETESFSLAGSLNLQDALETDFAGPVEIIYVESRAYWIVPYFNAIIYLIEWIYRRITRPFRRMFGRK